MSNFVPALSFRTDRFYAVVWAFWAIVVAAALILSQRIHLRPTIGLERVSEVIPSEFGQWQVISDVAVQIVNPQLRQSLKNDYDDVLNRVYMNRGNGRYVMLSIAYGHDQSH